MSEKSEKLDKRIRILNAAVDKAMKSGNKRAAESFNESLHRARMDRLRES